MRFIFTTAAITLVGFVACTDPTWEDDPRAPVGGDLTQTERANIKGFFKSGIEHMMEVGAFDSNYRILKFGMGSPEVKILLAMLAVPTTAWNPSVLDNAGATHLVYNELMWVKVRDCFQFSSGCEYFGDWLSESRVAEALFLKYGVGPLSINNANSLLAKVQFPSVTEEELDTLARSSVSEIFHLLPPSRFETTAAAAGAGVGAVRHRGRE